MARPSTDTYDLSDAEKRDLIKLIELGKPLPEKYRFLLFADKREVELVWNGKTREVCTAILPFQTLEHIDEPRKETGQVGRVSPLRAARPQAKAGAPDQSWFQRSKRCRFLVLITRFRERVRSNYFRRRPGAK